MDIDRCEEAVLLLPGFADCELLRNQGDCCFFQSRDPRSSDWCRLVDSLVIPRTGVVGLPRNSVLAQHADIAFIVEMRRYSIDGDWEDAQGDIELVQRTVHRLLVRHKPVHRVLLKVPGISWVAGVEGFCMHPDVEAIVERLGEMCGDLADRFVIVGVGPCPERSTPEDWKEVSESCTRLLSS